MEIGIVIAVVLLAVVGYIVLGKDKGEKSEPVEPTPVEPVRPTVPGYTEQDLMKKTKTELIALGAEMGLNLKSSDTKPNLIIQIVAGKEGAHLL